MGQIICTFAPTDELYDLNYNSNKPASITVRYISRLHFLEHNFGFRYTASEYMSELKHLQFEYDYIVIRVCRSSLKVLCRSELKFILLLPEAHLEAIMTSNDDLFQYGAEHGKKEYCDEIKQLARVYKKKPTIKIRYESSVEECINALEKRKFWKRNKIKL